MVQELLRSTGIESLVNGEMVPTLYPSSVGDLAKRAGLSGIQEWLSFYLKSPQTAPGLPPENDIFKQLIKLQNTLRHLMGEDLITHLGLDYYQDLVEAL